MILQVHQPAKLDASPALEPLEFARSIIRAEAAGLQQVADRLGDGFMQAVDLIFQCPGRLAITGIGKSADIGQKLAGTLNSMGTRSYVLDATRAVHGDLGMVHPNDIVLLLSHSGESEEIVRLLGPLRELSLALLGITGNKHSTLARKVDVPLIYGPLEEVCPLGLAPSASTTAMLALGDALAFTLAQRREFTTEDFARFHPAGSLGRKLLKVEAVMRPLTQMRIASATETVRSVFARGRGRSRRSGAVILLDENGTLVGLFTDSDLARLFEKRRDELLDRPIAEVMTREPFTVRIGTRLTEAMELLRRHKISELPVVDGDGKPVGLVDITDLIGIAPVEEMESPIQAAVA